MTFEVQSVSISHRVVRPLINHCVSSLDRDSTAMDNLVVKRCLHQTQSIDTNNHQSTINKIILDPQNAGLLALVKAARNGAVYGAKVRFPHALVYASLQSTEQRLQANENRKTEWSSSSVRERKSYIHRCTKREKTKTKIRIHI